MSGDAEFTPQFFDDASTAWRLNKITKPEGTFRYKRNAFSRPSVKPAAVQKPRRSARLHLLSRNKKKAMTK